MGARGSQEQRCDSSNVNIAKDVCSEAKSSSFCESAYRDALLRCEELRAERQQLLEVRDEVAVRIAKLAPSWQASDSEEDSEQEPTHDDGGIDAGCVALDSLELEDLLRHQEELEDEVEPLRDMLQTAASRILGVAEQSTSLGEYLEVVETQFQLQQSAAEQELPDSAAASEASSDESVSAQESSKVFDALLVSMKTQQDPLSLKLPTLGLMAAQGAAGSQASSSTATPRSARSEKSTGYWIEA